MDPKRYWSVEECCWVDGPSAEAPPALSEGDVEIVVPRQTEPAQEPARS
jgi:hypothetical protein